jgi:hypothetical protein
MSNFPNPSASSASSRFRPKETRAKDDSYISAKLNIDLRQTRAHRVEDTKQELDISSAVSDVDCNATNAPLTSSTIGAISTDGVTVGESDFSSSSSSTKRRSSVRFDKSPIGSSSSSAKTSNAKSSVPASARPAPAPTQPQLEREGSTDSIRSIVRSAAKRLHELDEDEPLHTEEDVGCYYDEGGCDYEGGFESSSSTSPNESKRTKREDTSK